MMYMYTNDTIHVGKKEFIMGGKTKIVTFQGRDSDGLIGMLTTSGVGRYTANRKWLSQFVILRNLFHPYGLRH